MHNEGFSPPVQNTPRTARHLPGSATGTWQKGRQLPLPPRWPPGAAAAAETEAGEVPGGELAPLTSHPCPQPLEPKAGDQQLCHNLRAAHIGHMGPATAALACATCQLSPRACYSCPGLCDLPTITQGLLQLPCPVQPADHHPGPATAALACATCQPSPCAVC